MSATATGEATGARAEPERLQAGDRDALRALSRTVGWPHTAADWHTILAAGVVYGIRAADGAPFACAAVFPYGAAASEGVAALGMVMVRPDWRGRGLGRTVTEACLAAGPATGTAVYLAATLEGRPLYEGLGFRTVARLAKMTRAEPVDPAAAARGAPVPAGHSLRPVDAAADSAAVRALDGAAFGAPRDAFIAARLDQAAAGALLLDATGAPVGYALAIDQGDLRLLGPIAAPDDAGALALAVHLAAGRRGPLRLDTLERRTGLVAGLEALGFAVADRPPVMALGAEALPGGGWPRYAAIAAQAFL